MSLPHELELQKVQLGSLCRTAVTLQNRKWKLYIEFWNKARSSSGITGSCQDYYSWAAVASSCKAAWGWYWPPQGYSCSASWPGWTLVTPWGTLSSSLGTSWPYYLLEFVQSPELLSLVLLQSIVHGGGVVIIFLFSYFLFSSSSFLKLLYTF